MSRVLSFRDIQRVPGLDKYTEVQLLSIERDKEVNEVLEVLGFDINQPILYVPSKHRDLAGKVAVGFRAVGQISGNDEYMNSRLCPLIEKLVWAAKRDPSLAQELFKLIGHSVNLEEEAIEEDGEFLDEEVEPDFDDITEQIQALEELRNVIRGWPYNDQGNLKTPKEYQE